MTKYFLSGCFNESVFEGVGDACRYRLFSVEYMGMVRNYAQWRERYARTYDEIMLDSGAYSVWTKGKVITVQDVIAKYKTCEALAGGPDTELTFINLDVMPGARGRYPEKEEIREALRQSDENFHILVNEFGPRILPVFHMNEPTERFDQLCEMSPFICLSPNQNASDEQRVNWVRRYLARRKHKCHGLATTSFKMMSSPFYSVDSSSWLLSASYGGITLPINNKLEVLCVSNESKAVEKLGQHIKTLNPETLQWVKQFVEGYGFTLENVSESYYARAVINAKVMIDMIESMGAVETVFTEEFFT